MGLGEPRTLPVPPPPLISSREGVQGFFPIFPHAEGWEIIWENICVLSAGSRCLGGIAVGEMGIRGRIRPSKASA